jgi:hypothetical protein
MKDDESESSGEGEMRDDEEQREKRERSKKEETEAAWERLAEKIKRARTEKHGEIQELTHMAGVSEKTTKWLLTGRGRHDPEEVTVPGTKRERKIAEREINLMSETDDVLDRAKHIPGWVRQVSVRDTDRDQGWCDEFFSVRVCQPLLIIIDAREKMSSASGWMGVQEIIDYQQQHGRYVAVIVGKETDRIVKTRTRESGWEFWQPEGAEWGINCNREDLVRSLGEKIGSLGERALLGLLWALVRDGRIRRGCIGLVSRSSGDRIWWESGERADGPIIGATSSDLGCIGSVSQSLGEQAKFWDDMSGEELEGEGVRKAREEEMEEFKKHEVYEKVPLSECWEKTGKYPIGTRCVDINKGDRENPEYRSRLVAQEINTGKGDNIFAATPPLEALKMLISIVTSEKGVIEGERVKLDVIDVRRAYFHAKARRAVNVRLPAEDATQGMCGILKKAMYGTRDAAYTWECERVEFMKDAGFMQGRASPCVFYHSEKNVRVVVHGHDFAAAGLGRKLDWFRKMIQKKFDAKFKARLGEGHADDRSVRVLNRIIEWVP